MRVWCDSTTGSLLSGGEDWEWHVVSIDWWDSKAERMIPCKGVQTEHMDLDAYFLLFPTHDLPTLGLWDLPEPKFFQAVNSRT